MHEARSFCSQFYWDWAISQSLMHECTNAQKFWWPKIWETGLNAWMQKFLSAILLGLSHISKFERMNTWKRKNIDGPKFEKLWQPKIWEIGLNAQTYERRSFWSQVYLNGFKPYFICPTISKILEKYWFLFTVHYGLGNVWQFLFWNPVTIVT